MCLVDKRINRPALSGVITCQFSASGISALLCPRETMEMWAIGNPASHPWQSVSHRVTPAPLKHPLRDILGFLMQRIQTCMAENLTRKTNTKKHRGSCHYPGIHIREQMLRLLLESHTSKTNKTGRKQNTQLTARSCDLLAPCKLLQRITSVLSCPPLVSTSVVTAVMTN